jgi:hypothetical protein
MSWNELERLVTAAEASHQLRRQLRRCSGSTELVTFARLLGYRINASDLRTARIKHGVEQRIQQRRRAAAG